MTKPTKEQQPNSESDPVAYTDLETTIQHRHPPQTDSQRSTERVVSKQDRDLAFAAALVRSGLANERRLGQFAKSWTAFGRSTLAEHAVRRGLLSQQQSVEIQSAASNLIGATSKQASQNADRSERANAYLSHLDPGGRLAKLLGIADPTTFLGDDSENRQVGARYTLLRKLGQGGLGVVWLARDENLQRYVAVKEISRDISPGDIALEHFRREAEITGRLEHPSIVPIYQYGRDEATGKAFYVMRFLGRRTLNDALTEYHERRESGNDDPMTLHRLLTSFVIVCQSVGHAHSRQVIHRDLKPANIALDQFGQVTLLDWGLAKINDETGVYDVNGRTEPGDLHSTGTSSVGRVIGTPLYMAPEQAAGRLDEVDELTDVYGLGGILYAILTGVAPHQATVDSLESRVSASEILSRIVADPVPSPEDLRPDVPPELSAICLKALSNKRYLRYGSAIELAEDVQRYIAGTPVRAYEAPIKRRVSRWMVKHPTIAQASLLMISLILIAGIFVAYGASQGHQSLVEARYASVQESARDLEINLKFEAQELERDLHFITELPLMEAITESQRTRSDGTTTEGLASEGLASEGLASEDSAPQDDSVDSDATPILPSLTLRDMDRRKVEMMMLSPELWLERQGDLFDGFLNANPSYLMMVSCIKEEDDSFRELVRSERLSAGLRAHRVPKKQLMVSEPDGGTGQNLNLIDSLRPGTVLLLTNDQIAEDIPTNNRSPLILSGVGAVYDTDGEYFGLNVIELDLRQRLENLLLAVAPVNVIVCVTDLEGKIAMSYQDGKFDDVAENELITKQFPQLKPLFESGSTLREIGDGKSYYATLVDLGGPTSSAKIGIVTHILDVR